MRIAVLGASGRCGAHVVRSAARRGHEVTAVVRESSGYRPPTGVTELRGEVLEPAFLEAALAGHATVLSCLGLRRAGVLPWSALMSPHDLVQSATRLLLELTSVEARVIWISAGGVADSRALLTPLVRQLISTANVGVAYRDLEVAEALVRERRQAWLAVRPVTLTPGARTGTARPVQRYGVWSHVRRADVAEWMLDVADGTRSYDQQTVLLGS